MAFAWLFVQTFRILNNLSASFVDIWCCLNHFKVFFKSMRLIYFLLYGWWHFRCTHSTRPQTHFFLLFTYSANFIHWQKATSLKMQNGNSFILKWSTFHQINELSTQFSKTNRVVYCLLRSTPFFYITRTFSCGGSLWRRTK